MTLALSSQPKLPNKLDRFRRRLRAHRNTKKTAVKATASDKLTIKCRLKYTFDMCQNPVFRFADVWCVCVCECVLFLNGAGRAIITKLHMYLIVFVFRDDRSQSELKNKRAQEKTSESRCFQAAAVLRAFFILSLKKPKLSCTFNPGSCIY